MKSLLPAAVVSTLLLAFSVLCRAQADNPAPPASLRAIPLKTIDGKPVTLSAWTGKVLLIVNVASECGNTPQYTALEALHKKYGSAGFSVLGFPCNDFGGQEPGNAAAIKAFCTSKYRVTFPLFEKIAVKGPSQHALYAALTGKSSPVPGEVKWNFGKFLIGRDGTILKRWDPDVKPDAQEVTQAIETALAVKGGAPVPGKASKDVTFFGTPSRGNNIIFCLNTGGATMALAGMDGIHAIRRELKNAITALPPDVRFNIVCFGGHADVFKPESVPAAEDMKKEAMRFLEGYYGSAGFMHTRTMSFGRAGKDSDGIEYVPVMSDDFPELRSLEGGSRIELGLAAAFQRHPTTIFVVAANRPGTRKQRTDKEMDPSEVLKLITATSQRISGKAPPPVVHTTCLHSNTKDGEEGRSFLNKLATRFKGVSREVKPPKSP